MNIYLNELKALRKSAIIWTCSMTALSFLYLSIYPSIAADATDFKQLLSNYPESIRAMLGINLDYIASLIGFYSMIFSFIILCGTIQSTILGVSILSKEVRERTADFLLVKPVSRTAIVSAKLLAALTIILLTDAIFYSVSVLLANAVKTIDYSNQLFFLINLTLLFIQLIFLAAGMLISLFFNKLKSVLPISLGLVFGFYILGAILTTGKDEEKLRVLSPFQYYKIPYIIEHAAYEIPYLILGGAIIVCCITASFMIYKHKDIHAVS
jgi:ABC-2 type transport system permease protein